jgi:hypothetical protein
MAREMSDADIVTYARHRSYVVVGCVDHFSTEINAVVNCHGA